MATRLPVLFVSHGSPLHSVQDNGWNQGFRSLSGLIPRPRAIVVISAHWFTDGIFLTGNENPPTIHDFYGFPQELYEIRYPAPGDVQLARRVRGLIGDDRAELRTDWGFDHGMWCVLRCMYPKADVPAVQLSIDRRLDSRGHFNLARTLGPLREEGVLIVGSGCVTHNLRDLMIRMQAGDLSTPPWAAAFDLRLKEILLAHDTGALIDLWPGFPPARMAHPTPDHFLPILYGAAVADQSDPVSFPMEGFDYSVSMRAIMWG